MPSSWLTLVPPVIVIASALTLHKIHVALGLGFLSGLLVASQGDFVNAFYLGITSITSLLTNIDALCLYGFLLCLGILVSLFNTAGGAAAFAHIITRRIKSIVGLECASIMLSLCMFVDDYLSILAIGHMMTPIADRYKIARLKLAFLIHSFAGPLAILFPVSSWAATIVMYLDQTSIHGTTHTQHTDTFGVYLSALPYTLYSFLIISSVWIIIKYKISFGLMKQHEHDRPAHIVPFHTPENPSIWGLTLPLCVLIATTALGLLYTRNAMCDERHPFLIMLIAAVLAIITGIIVVYHEKQFSPNLIKTIMYNGTQIMLGPIGTVFLAALLSNLLINNIETGYYLAQLLQSTIPLFLIPVIFFITALFATFATGSAWGTFAIVIPIAIPMIASLNQIPEWAHLETIPLLLPTLGAIFSGAVCGDQISPISDTSIMTAVSTQVKVIDHFFTQLPYTIPAIIGCLIGFTVAGYATLFMPHYAFIVSIASAFLGCMLTLILCIIFDQKIRNQRLSQNKDLS